jgi:hypothetical protein
MNKKKNSQKKIINELKNQILIQAERLGIRELYTPAVMAELKVDSARKILNDFYAERSNLEYELNMLGSQKQEVLIKLERLNYYIRKAEGLREKNSKQLDNLLEKTVGDRKKTNRALRRVRPKAVSVAV